MTSTGSVDFSSVAASLSHAGSQSSLQPQAGTGMGTGKGTGTCRERITSTGSMDFFAVAEDLSRANGHVGADGVATPHRPTDVYDEDEGEGEGEAPGAFGEK